MARPAQPPRPDPGPSESPAKVIAETADDILDAAERRRTMTGEPEHNLIAALLTLSAHEAGEVLALVENDDVADYMARAALGCIRDIVARDEQPTPQAVAARARAALDSGPTDPQRDPPPSVRRMVIYLSDAYSMGLPVTAWPMAATVVEDSYRRMFAQHGLHIAQMAEAFADVEDLEQVTAADLRLWRATRIRVLTLRRRARTANP